MTRNISPAARADIQAPASPHALLGFLTISHRTLAVPIRVVSDPRPFIVGGETYIGCPFGFQLLTDEDQAPTTKLKVQNVDRRIGETLRTVTDQAEVELAVRSTANFDLSVVPRVEIGSASVLYGFRHFKLIDITVTPIEVTGTVRLRDYTQEPWPGKRATQTRCPGLFR